MDFESFLYIIVLFTITIFISGAFIASQIASNSQGKNDVSSSLIKALSTGDFASAFNNILTGVANKTIGTALIPIKETIDSMINTMDTLNNNIHSGKKMVSQTRGFAFTSINDFVNQIYSVIGSVQTMVMRIMYLMKRVVAVFVSIIYATRSGLAIGESFSNSVFGKILMFFCLEERAIIELKSGEKRYISQLRIGDELKHDGVVEGLVRCDGRYISLYELDGVKISGEHYVYSEERDVWIPVKYHSRAKLIEEKHRYLYNIETSKHTITLVNGVRCLDYDDDGILYKWLDQWVSRIVAPKSGSAKSSGEPVLIYNYREKDENGNEVINEDVMYYDKTKDIYLWRDGKKVCSILNENIDFLDRMITNNLFRL
jgi:hypothetical protein